MKEASTRKRNTFEAALKLDRSNSWVYYNLGLLYLEQRNWQLALDNFEASLNGTIKPSWIEVWAHIKKGMLTTQKASAIAPWRNTTRPSSPESITTTLWL